MYIPWGTSGRIGGMLGVDSERERERKRKLSWLDALVDHLC